MSPQALTASTSEPGVIDRVQILERSEAESLCACSRAPVLAVIVPTYNERDNVAEFLQRLEAVLTHIPWEVIFVDDDSFDGTAECITGFASRNPHVRLVRRVGRRGLASACIEGMLATTARYLAVMDADLQHDEGVLPAMLARLRTEDLDLVIATRNADGGSMGQFCSRRRRLSGLGRQMSRVVCRSATTDPMSGYFVVTQSFFIEVVHRLYGGGFKILLDLLASSRRPVRLGEVGYTFRLRRSGESKLDVNTAVEYLFLVLHKLTGGLVPSRFGAFALVGTAGVITHLLTVTLLLKFFHLRFFPAQVMATYLAMTENFFLNNLITWRDRSLRGAQMFRGMLTFYGICSFGAWANVLFARALLQGGVRWEFAALAGIVLSSVWNYSMANLFTWQRKPAVNVGRIDIRRDPERA